MKIGLFLDISNLYHGAKLVHNSKINYEKYYQFVAENLGEISVARAYGTQKANEAKDFIFALTKIGFTPVYKETKVIIQGNKKVMKGDVDTMIVVDIIDQLDNFDTLVLGSADADFLPAVQYCLKHGKQVMILACNISHDYDPYVEAKLEVHRGLLE